MHAKSLEELQVFQKSHQLTIAVLTIVRAHRTEQRLAEQLGGSAESVMANIAEGYQQSTDRAFARYLVIAAGSAEETRVHLLAAEVQGWISHERNTELAGQAREIVKMLRSLIRYLQKSDRKHRCPGY